jgi:hypothetical protein
MDIKNIKTDKKTISIDNILYNFDDYYFLDNETYTIYTFMIGNIKSKLYEFKLNDSLNLFKKYISFIYYLVSRNIDFNIGINVYKNILYIIIDNYKTIYNININNLLIVVDQLSIDNYENTFSSNNYIAGGGYGKVYDYNKNNNSVIKVGSFENGINEFIIYLKLCYKIRKMCKDNILNSSLNLANYKKVIMYINKNCGKDKNGKNPLADSKFLFGIIMPKYQNINDMLKNYSSNINELFDKLYNFIDKIKILNENIISLFDLKTSNVMWDEKKNDYILIDYGAIQIDNIDFSSFTSSKINTQLYMYNRLNPQCDNRLYDDYDVYGCMDLLYSHIRLSWYSIIQDQFTTSKFITYNKSSNIVSYRKHLNGENDNMINNMINSINFSLYKKSLNGYEFDELYCRQEFKNFLLKCFKSTLKYNDILSLIIFIKSLTIS